MRRNRNKIIVVLLILLISIGFAFLSSNLSIIGLTSVAGNKWDVHFENVQVNEDSVEADDPVIDNTKTAVNYSVQLKRPGDFYEFAVDAKNAGTIDAKIDTITTSGISSDIESLIDFSVKYIDGRNISNNDLLLASKYRTYVVRLEYKKDIDAADLNEDGFDLNISFSVKYVQSDISINESDFVKKVKSNAQDDSNINFKDISSDTNGKGLYLLSYTDNDAYPIYYYRGNVSDNNAKFAGFCWKVVRTTDTGGIKLIYNGVPDQNGYCNARKTGTQLSTNSPFDSTGEVPKGVGYMYSNKHYTVTNIPNDSSYIYGSDVLYSNGSYTLVDTGKKNNYRHYTCSNSSNTCEKVYYVFHEYGDSLELIDGEDIIDALNNMKNNETSSSVKVVIDDWFKNTFKTYFDNNGKDYKDYLEDTVWCNDRSVSTDEQLSFSGWVPNGGEYNKFLYFSPYYRTFIGEPSLTCPNKNDAFTVDDIQKGNGSLEYPVGLLTSDEVILAGGQSGNNPNFYLNTGEYWLTMSPSYCDSNQWGSFCYQHTLYSNSYFSSYIVYSSSGVRPSISISSNVKLSDVGDGTEENPYEFLLD